MRAEHIDRHLALVVVKSHIIDREVCLRQADNLAQVLVAILAIERATANTGQPCTGQHEALKVTVFESTAADGLQLRTTCNGHRSKVMTITESYLSDTRQR